MSLQRSLIAHDHRPILDRLPSRIRFAAGTADFITNTRLSCRHTQGPAVQTSSPATPRHPAVTRTLHRILLAEIIAVHAPPPSLHPAPTSLALGAVNLTACTSREARPSFFFGFAQVQTIATPRSSSFPFILARRGAPPNAIAYDSYHSHAGRYESCRRYLRRLVNVSNRHGCRERRNKTSTWSLRDNSRRRHNFSQSSIRWRRGHPLRRAYLTPSLSQLDAVP